MFRSVHASHNHQLYLALIHGTADIADLVRDDRLDTITSIDRQLVFWFTVNRTVRIMNRRAAAMLVATTHFITRDVPLLPGSVIITGRDRNGGPAGLTDEQVNWLAALELQFRDARILDRRLSRISRRHRAQSAAIASR